MKILFFIRSLQAGGAERVLVTIANELARRGHHITVATTTALPIAYEVSPSVKLTDILRGKNYKANKIRTACRLFYNIRSITKTEKPDVVVSFLSGMNKYVIMALYRSRYPVIACEHTTFNKPSQRHSLAQYIIRWQINKLADKVTVLTEYDKHYVGNRIKNIVVMPNPLSFDAITEELFKNSDSKRRNILVCGSLDRHVNKGFDEMISKYRMIADKYPNCDLDILGGGREDSVNYLKRLIVENNLVDRIHLLGYSKNVSNEMLKHKYFVLCSKTEGMPMALMEAMAIGCACISFACISGPSEIINDGEDGILVEDQNFDALLQQLSDLIENDRKRRTLALKAIHNIQRFSLKKIGDKWEILLREVERH